MKIRDYRTYKEAKEHFNWNQIWDVFDGNRERFNIAYECIDRHVGKGTAVRIKFDDGHVETYSFAEISRLSSQFANALEKSGIRFGDRVAIMLDPCWEFYVSLFGTLKRGAIAVPCFPLFGHEAIQYRIKDSGAKHFITTKERVSLLGDLTVDRVLTTGSEFTKWIEKEEEKYSLDRETTAKDVAVFQYTSGATSKFPEAIKHFHRSVATLMPTVLFGIGLREGDSYFCPSSPAWGHGMWYGTMAPLALGIAAGAYSGQFNEERLFEALEEFEINNISAAPTVFRRLKNSGLADQYNLKIHKISFTGEPMDTETFHYLREKFGASPCSLYGSTEVGVIILNYGGFSDWEVKPGSMGKPMLGLNIQLIDDKGEQVPQGAIGEIAMKRHDQWFRVKDAAHIDEDGYYWHKGRVDDIIISSGWTISSSEVEDTLLKHREVEDAAVIGIPDKERGEIIKAFIKALHPGPWLEQELKNFVKERLGKHEYPRVIEFIDAIPKTPGGKTNRKELKLRAIQPTEKEK
ncbi:MAG: acyl-CoA synthetase [Deltaproteobacteria bacterium]|nr:acyl-CoA synthetase [Deltaproteobacteria bacterium]